MPYRYRFAGRTVELEPEPGLVAVRFQPGPKSMRSRATEAAGVGPFFMRFEVPGEELTIVPVGAATSIDETSSATATLAEQPHVVHAMPVFRTGRNYTVPTDRIIVGVRSAEFGTELSLKHGVEIVESEDRRMLLRVAPGDDPFALIAALENEPGVRFAEPDFVTIGTGLPEPDPALPIPEDDLLARQYALRITRAIEAWELVPGKPEVRVAVLDVGVQTTHPDLAPAVVGAYDAIANASGPQPNSWDWHGTACAGLVAAAANDFGIRGVAWGVSLLAVRIAQSVVRGEPWKHAVTEIRAGIKWAWQNGADVLTNSWGVDPPSTDIMEELENARTLGRDGLGCVIVAAAGNDYGSVAFPATLPTVLAVSASNEHDHPKTPQSPDGYGWGTNHGPEIDVAAPGVHNATTDISGGGSTNDDYMTNFFGTSSAAPIVAGACALVLSANPGLSEAEVRHVITSTAEKVGPIAYADGRNDFFGNGRLNVYEAVVRALEIAGAGVPRNREQ